MVQEFYKEKWHMYCHYLLMNYSDFKRNFSPKVTNAVACDDEQVLN